MRWIFLLLISVISNVVLCQSRKTQIESLSQSLDSISNVLTFERLQHMRLYDSYELNSEKLYDEQEKLLYYIDTFRSHTTRLNNSLNDYKLLVQNLRAELNSTLSTNDTLMEYLNTLKFKNNLLDRIDPRPLYFTAESNSENSKFFITRSIPSNFSESGETINLGNFSLQLITGFNIIFDQLGVAHRVYDGFSIQDKNGNPVLTSLCSPDYLNRYTYFVGDKGEFLLVLKEYNRNDFVNSEFNENNTDHEVQFIFGTSLNENNSDYFIRKSDCFNMNNLRSYQIIKPGYVLLIHPHDLCEIGCESIRWEVSLYDPYYDNTINLGTTKGLYKIYDINNNLFYNKLKSSVDDQWLYNSIIRYTILGKI